MSFVLALDQGTTGSTALVFDETARVRGSGDREIAQHYPASGHVEHDPEEIFATTVAVAREAMAAAHVIARDSAGREWAALMTGPTTATFLSLPVGTYTLEFDLSELTEPLVPRAPIPLLIVTGKDSKSITITLDPRPIRMWTPPATKSGGAQKNNATLNESGAGTGESRS